MIFTQLFLRQYDLGMQFLCRQQMTSLSADDHLFRAVRSCDGDFIFPPDLMCNFFDILICGFRFLCINDMDIMILLYLARKSLYLICIKYKDQGTLPDSLIIAQNVHQPPARTVNVDLGQLAEFFPCKDNIITVHQQIFLSALPFSALIFSGTV
ncbi:unknown [Lachnospiraceae bacterium CAG:215]|nr:unknown [Lachnospiraceae bacterium CAG:215]